MRRNAKKLRIFGLVCAWALPLLFFTAKNLTASLYTPKTITKVRIDNINFGQIDDISGLNQFTVTGLPSKKGETYAEITLSRDFVTDPSLYLWAQKRMSKKSELKNIELITEDEKGNVTSRKVLEMCQPLTWTVEARSPALGGFNETIGLAVRKISTF
jgi:hypothetical protein